MSLSRSELAVLNNVQWYEAVFAAHGLPFETHPLVWLSHQTPPPFHSNLVVLSKDATQAQVEAFIHHIASTPRPGGWSLKDSYACLDLVPLGFSQLFEANWIWRDAPASGALDAPSHLVWSRVSTAAGLLEWESAWAGDANDLSAPGVRRQFPEQLLLDRRVAFLAGRAQGEVVAGGILNQSPGVVGVSNVFARPSVAPGVWPAVVQCAAKEFPGVPLVGYERGADLEAAQQVGFVPIGALRVWWRGE